jgi:hypothetical protein
MLGAARSTLKDFVPGKLLENYGTESTRMKAFYWICLVNSYGVAQLTFPTDRLIALSGVAREVQKMLQTTYIAGMWKDHLPECLLWQTYGDNHHAVTPKYVAPSWSWASAARSIVQPDYTNAVVWPSVRPCATVLDVGVTLANSDDPFGQVTDGYLRMQGKLGVMKWSGAPEEPFYALVQIAGADLNVLDFSTTLQPHESVQRRDLSAYIHVDDASADIGEGWQAYFLPIQLQNWDKLIHQDDPKREGIIGLLLAYLPCGNFKRLGIADIRVERFIETFDSLTDGEITII